MLLGLNWEFTCKVPFSIEAGHTKGPPESLEQWEIPPASELAQIIPGKSPLIPIIKFIQKKITKPKCDFQLSLGATLELTTFYLPPKYYFSFILLVGYTLFLIFNENYGSSKIWRLHNAGKIYSSIPKWSVGDNLPKS